VRRIPSKDAVYAASVAQIGKIGREHLGRHPISLRAQSRRMFGSFGEQFAVFSHSERLFIAKNRTNDYLLDVYPEKVCRSFFWTRPAIGIASPHRPVAEPLSWRGDGTRKVPDTYPAAGAP
jgi:hypothetical protein